MKKRIFTLLLTLSLLFTLLTLPIAADSSETHTEIVQGMLGGEYVDYMEITDVTSVGTFPYEVTEIPVYYANGGCRVTVLQELEPGDYPYTGKFHWLSDGTFEYDHAALDAVSSLISFTDPADGIPYILPGSTYDLTDGTWFFGDSNMGESFLVVVNSLVIGEEFDTPAAPETPDVPPSVTDFMTDAVFTDVPVTEYFADPVAWAVDLGITNGTSATTFSPYNTCTRGQIITFLWRAAGSPEPGWTNYFPDVPADAYYTKAVAWAVERGIVPVTDSFAPEADCTRAMVAEFLWRYADCPGVATASPFYDVPSDAAYSTAVAWALEQGVTTGTSDTTFSPYSTCTRAQIVTFLWRAFA